MIPLRLPKKRHYSVEKITVRRPVVHFLVGGGMVLDVSEGDDVYVLAGGGDDVYASVIGACTTS